MNMLEREVVEKFNLLDKEAQQRVRHAIMAMPESATHETFDYEAWFAETKAIREEIRAANGGQSVDVVGLLRDIRDGEDE